MGWVKKAAKKAKKAVTHTAHSVGHAIEKGATALYKAPANLAMAGVELLQGDLKGAQERLVKASGYAVQAAGFTSGVGLIVPKMVNTGAQLAKSMTAYGTGNFSMGSNYLEAATGVDVFGRQGARAARAAEAEAQAEYDRQAAEANAASERNRRANLLATRKSLTPSFGRSSQGGGAGSQKDGSGVGGIVLG